MTPSLSRRSDIARVFAAYALVIFAPLLVLNQYLLQTALEPSEHPLADSLLIKTRHYKANAREYNLLLIGDSRTYISLQPHRLDTFLETRTVNLATWGHYFATQYAQLEDIIPIIPPDTTLLWSIGHRNFQPLGEALWSQIYPPAQREPFAHGDDWWLEKFPIGATNAPTYLAWGYPWYPIKQNLLRFGPLGETIEKAKALRFTYNRRKNNPVASIDFFNPPPPRPVANVPPPAPVSPTNAVPPHTIQSALATLSEGLLNTADIATTQLLYAEGRATSLLVHTRQGSYYRIELDPQFFRERQRALAEDIQRRKTTIVGQPEFIPAPPLWHNFAAILDLLGKHNINVVVNELEEAPYIYGAWGGKEALRTFMREKVKPHVEAQGILYLRIDFDQLTDADYFDFDHLNARGIEKFTPMLADALRPHLTQQAP